MKFIRENPAVFKPLAGLTVTILAKFGLDLSAEQVLILFGVISTVVSLWVRRSVTPVERLKNHVAVDGVIVEDVKSVKVETTNTFPGGVNVTTWKPT